MIKFLAASSDITATDSGEAQVCPLADVLCNKFGDRFREYCMNGDKISKNIQIFINGRSYVLLGGEKAAVHLNDEIIVCPAIGGG